MSFFGGLVSRVEGTRFVVPALDPRRVDPKLVEAAQGMEANFLKQMLRQMRESVPENEETRSNQAIQLFRGMLDDHYAEETAKVQGIGISEMIVRYLTQQDTVALPPRREPEAPLEGNTQNLVSSAGAVAEGWLHDEEPTSKVGDAREASK